MTERADIFPSPSGWRRLSYTARCGWVDWGHALPAGPAGLKRQIDGEAASHPLLNRLSLTLEGEPAFVVNYGQAMGAGIVGVSLMRHWIIRKGLAAPQKESVALAIYLDASHQFETLQGSFPFFIASGASSYSPEDLVSNLIGFYAAYRRMAQAAVREMCGEVSVEESLRIWDEHLPDGLGGIKNKSTRPILFPTKEGPGDTSFPRVFQTIIPAPRGTLWTKLKTRFIDGALVNVGAALNITRDGRITYPR